MKRVIIIIGIMATMLIMHSNSLVRPERVAITNISTCSEIPNDSTTLDEWDVFVEALIWVESRGKADAVGETNDFGILQITPIYVADANRIIGHDKYAIDDAFCPKLSLEMFSIIQSHYNPSKCLKTAISRHNPKAGEWYANKIFDKMNEIKQKKS